jgi:hypothetical protein
VFDERPRQLARRALLAGADDQETLGRDAAFLELLADPSLAGHRVSMTWTIELSMRNAWRMLLAARFGRPAREFSRSRRGSTVAPA